MHKILFNRDESCIPHKGKSRHSNYQANLKIVDIRKPNLNQFFITSSYLVFKYLTFSWKKKRFFFTIIANRTSMFLEIWQYIFMGLFCFPTTIKSMILVDCYLNSVFFIHWKIGQQSFSWRLWVYTDFIWPLSMKKYKLSMKRYKRQNGLLNQSISTNHKW